MFTLAPLRFSAPLFVLLVAGVLALPAQASDFAPDADQAAKANRCGDGVTQDAEECDGDDLQGQSCTSLHYPEGRLRCASSCQFDTSLCRGDDVCGNGLHEEGEACDEGDQNVTDCPYGESSCEVCSASCELIAGKAHYCGDGLVDPQEQCDGEELGSSTCSDFGYDGGELGCGEDCRLEFSDCLGSVCGNGIVDADEECDDGDRNTTNCEYGSESCEVCRPDCTMGAGEASWCGDGVIDTAAGESCDGDQVPANACELHGLGEGTPRCTRPDAEGKGGCFLDLTTCPDSTPRTPAPKSGCAVAGGPGLPLGLPGVFGLLGLLFLFRSTSNRK